MMFPTHYIAVKIVLNRHGFDVLSFPRLSRSSKFREDITQKRVGPADSFLL